MRHRHVLVRRLRPFRCSAPASGSCDHEQGFSLDAFERTSTLSMIPGVRLDLEVRMGPVIICAYVGEGACRKAGLVDQSGRPASRGPQGVPPRAAVRTVGRQHRRARPRNAPRRHRRPVARLLPGVQDDRAVLNSLCQAHEKSSGSPFPRPREAGGGPPLQRAKSGTLGLPAPAPRRTRGLTSVGSRPLTGAAPGLRTGLTSRPPSAPILPAPGRGRRPGGQGERGIRQVVMR